MKLDIFKIYFNLTILPHIYIYIYIQFFLLKIFQNTFFFLNLCFWEMDKGGHQRVIYSNYINKITNNKKTHGHG